MAEVQDATVHPARHQVLPMSRRRSCSTSLLQAERRIFSLRRSTQVRRLFDERPEEMRQLQRRPRFGFKDCPNYLEAKAIVRRAAEENTSYRDVFINMRKDEREDKKRAAAHDLPSGTTSTSTAPGQTTLDDDVWAIVS